MVGTLKPLSLEKVNNDTFDEVLYMGQHLEFITNFPKPKIGTNCLAVYKRKETDPVE